MRKFHSHLYWWKICFYQESSEDFMIDFQDNLYWKYISEYQIFSEDFIRQFECYFDRDSISYT